MIVIPAIDLRGGKVVRLTKGDYDQESVYSESPLETAHRFLMEGARRIHVIDLDGARAGKPTQVEVIQELVRDVATEIQVGGGIRTPETIDRYLALGVSRVILGTRACLDRGFLKECLGAFQKKVIVGIDARDGKVATEGWTKITDIRVEQILEEVAGLGGEEIIYTDISRDGMLEGPNVDEIKRLSQRTSLKLIASGGVSGRSDIEKLLDLKLSNLLGVIVGKAIYEKKIDFKEAVEICRKASC